MKGQDVHRTLMVSQAHSTVEMAQSVMPPLPTLSLALTVCLSCHFDLHYGGILQLMFIAHTPSSQAQCQVNISNLI